MKRSSFLNCTVLTLCLLAFACGVYELDRHSLWWDESLSHYRASKPLPYILANRMSFLNGTGEIRVTPDNHPPLYFVLLRALTLAAGDSEFALRFLSVAAGVLAVPLLYQCGLLLADRYAGLLAALLGALSPLYLWAQQEARPYALGTLWAILAFYALVRALQGSPPPVSIGRPNGRRWRIGWGLSYLIATAALLATHYHGLLLLLPQGAMLLLARAWDRRRLFLGLCATGVVAGVAAVWTLRGMVTPLEVPGYSFVPLGTLLEDVLRSFPLGVTGDQSIPWHWISAGYLLAALAVLFARRSRVPRQNTLYLVFCFLLPIAEIYALSFVRPAYMNVRHLIFASPFYYLLLAAGISQVRHLGIPRPQRVHVTALAVVALLLGMVLSTVRYRTQFDKEDHRGWGRYLSEHVRPTDLVLVNPGASGDLYTYYVHNPAPYFGFPLMGEDEASSISQLEQLVRENDRVWVALSSTPWWASLDNLAVKWLTQHTTPIASASFHSDTTIVQAHAFRLNPPVVDALPGSVTPIALSFGDQLHLLAWDSPAKQGRAGHTLQLSLYWSAQRPVEQEYRVALSIGDDRGFTWAALDYAPCSGRFPSTQWPAGQIVRDDVDVDLPPGIPPGHYRLNLSVYPADRSGPALAAHDLHSGALRGLIVAAAEIEVVAPEEPPREDEIPLQHKITRHYGDIALLGHNFRGGKYQPGEVIPLDAYWRAVRTPRQDVNLALRLIDESGTTRATRTVAPAEGYEPTLWHKGEVVWGQYRLRIPVDAPPGEYTVCLAEAGPEPGGKAASSAWAKLVQRLRPSGSRCVALNTLTIQPRTDSLSFEIPTLEHALRANLGDQVELLGYDLDMSTVRPGQVVSYTLYWRALQAVDRDYTVFNHLVAHDGQVQGQWDNQPQRGSAPTTRWVPGQVIADSYQVPVSANAPPGPLQLVTGMYDLLTMARLPVYDEQGKPAGDAIFLAEIEVTKP